MITLPGGRKIGPGEPPFIIAEIGSNWTTLDDCLHSVVQAKACGADAVKFQAYSHGALYGWTQYVACYERDTGRVLGTARTGDVEHFIPGQLPLDWLPLLKQKADAVGIEFMCSAFSPELIDAVDPFVNLHKVASAECTHKRMLERLREIGKPVLLSTGAHGVEDIRQALDVLAGRNTQTPEAAPLPIVLLYCVAAYPAKRVNPRMMNEMADHFGLSVGYGFSDHTLDVYTAPLMANDTGICSVFEKHITFLEPCKDRGVYITPDMPHSLTADEFKEYIAAANGRWKDVLSPTVEEKPMVLRHNRRLIATREIEIGESFKESVNFGIYRSLKDETHAYGPMAIDEINGRVSQRRIQAGEGIGPGDL